MSGGAPPPPQSPAVPPSTPGQMPAVPNMPGTSGYMQPPGYFMLNPQTGQQVFVPTTPPSQPYGFQGYPGSAGFSPVSSVPSTFPPPSPATPQNTQPPAQASVTPQSVSSPTEHAETQDQSQLYISINRSDLNLPKYSGLFSAADLERLQSENPVKTECVAASESVTSAGVTDEAVTPQDVEVEGSRKSKP